jgi:hypothetical protein
MVLDGESKRPIPHPCARSLHGIFDGEEVLCRGGWELEQMDQVARIELEAESWLTLGVAAEVAGLATDAVDAVMGKAGENPFLEELSREGDLDDSPEEFREDVAFHIEALGSDLCRDVEGCAEGITDSFSLVVHDRFLSSFRSLSSL